jgi:surfeit locus 1 family protein
MQLSVKLFSKKWVFSPHRWLTVLVILLLPILLSLAYWQWQRGVFKQSMLDAFAVSQTTLPFVGQASLPLPPYQSIRVQGHFKPAYQFFLDNQMHDGKAGFQVLIPFELETSKEWLLVNLGWLQRNAKRVLLPEFPAVSTEEMILTGRTYLPSQNYLLLGTHLEEITPNKMIIQTLDFQRLSEFLQHDLVPLVLLQDPDTNLPFVRDWQPPQTMPPAKHYGYALQWLLLAITLVILYFVFCTRKENL